jgi:DNA mismatch repair protein MutS2
MKYFLDAAYGKTLVLIDEFGSGSDPDLGSSMAQVFLRALNESKTYGVMTTHYNSIKALASDLPRVENGSMQFNSKDLTPEFKLNQGVPGSSYTYEVAQQVGVDKRLIEQARSVLNESTVAMDRLLVGIQKEKNQLAHQRVQLSSRLEELELLKEKQDRKIAQLEDKVRRQSAMNEQQNAMITWGKKFQGLVNEYAEQRSKKGKDEVVGRFKVYAGERANQTQNERTVKKTQYEKQQERKIKKLTSAPVKIGDRVKLIGSRQPGEIIEIKKDQFLLAIGALTTWATRDKFIPAESLHGDQGTPKGKARGGVKEAEVQKAVTSSGPKSKQEAAAEKKKAKKSGKNSQKTSKTALKKPKNIKNKAKTPEKSPKEKLNEVADSKPLKTIPAKKMTGKKKPDDLTPQQRAQLEQPLKKVASPATKEAQKPRDSTDADLEKLKAFFGKK